MHRDKGTTRLLHNRMTDCVTVSFEEFVAVVIMDLAIVETPACDQRINHITRTLWGIDAEMFEVWLIVIQEDLLIVRRESMGNAGVEKSTVL